MNARDKAYIGATAVFDAPQKREPTEREMDKTRQVLKTLADCTEDEMAQVLMGCILLLGDKLAEKRQNAKR